jgi:aminoglycoside 2''-phosphotransferase
MKNTPNKQETYLNTVLERYPALAVRDIRLHDGEGQYNDILIVNDQIIFRFPKYAAGIQTLRKELRILRRLQGRTPLPVPNPIYHSGDEQRPGKVFMGYQMLPGEPLWRDTLLSIQDEAILQRLAAQLAGFLKQLHALPVDDFRSDLPVQDSLAEFTGMYAEIRARLFDHMRPEASEQVARQFEDYLGTPRLHAHPLVVQHGDFGGSNILFDRGSQTISGVIDFGFARLGDPAQDIAAVSTLGDAFLARFTRTYPEIEAMLERARFYKSTFALSEALHGVTSADREAFDAGMAQYI